MDIKIIYIHNNVAYLTHAQKQNIAEIINNYDDRLIHTHLDGIRISYADMSPELIEIIYNIIYTALKK